MSAAAERVTAFLDEMDRVDAANRWAAHYADTIYSLNDIELTRADLREILAVLTSEEINK